MYSDTELIQISALQHYEFCKRQCALIHLEQSWLENRFTAEGRTMHEKVHGEANSSGKNLRVDRGVPLISYEFGLSGKSDLLEFHKSAENGKWVPFPVEYKRGSPQLGHVCCDQVQLCAQALCLEEMLSIELDRGALFYGKNRRRLEVLFDSALRKKTETAIHGVHELFECGRTPVPVYTKKCESCSLLGICLPDVFEKRLTLREYFKREIGEF